MSLAEIKTAVDTLTDDERDELAWIVQSRTDLRDPEWLAEMDRRIDAYKRGEFATEDEVHHLCRPGAGDAT